MKKFLLFILTILASSMFTSCEGQTKLPKELPLNIEIIYKNEGGLAPSFFSIVISGNMMKVSDQSAETAYKNVVWEANLSDDQLKELYRVFVENKFDLIKPNKDIGVADGKSRSIEMKFDQKRFYAVTGDGIEMTKDHAERFRNIESAIEKLMRSLKDSANVKNGKMTD